MPVADRNWAGGTIFSLQSLFGILGNFSLLSYYLSRYCTGCKQRSTDLIVTNLTVANLMVLFSGGVRDILESFRCYQVLSDLACKLIPYVRVVGRGMSISATCLLSVFQAITICPMSSRWAQLKRKAPRYIVPSLALCWIVNMLVKVFYPIFIGSSSNLSNSTTRKTFGYCSAVRHDPVRDRLYAALLCFPDAVSVVLMLWSSVSMAFILHRHQQRLQHLHKNRDSSRSSPESRATKTILLLVSTFVCFYTLSSILSALVSIIKKPTRLLLNINSVLLLSFPTVSPFVLLSQDSSVSRLCPAWMVNKKTSSPERNVQ